MKGCGHDHWSAMQVQHMRQNRPVDVAFFDDQFENFKSRGVAGDKSCDRVESLLFRLCGEMEKTKPAG